MLSALDLSNIRAVSAAVIPSTAQRSRPVFGAHRPTRAVRKSSQRDVGFMRGSFPFAPQTARDPSPSVGMTDGEVPPVITIYEAVHQEIG